MSCNTTDAASLLTSSMWRQAQVGVALRALIVLLSCSATTTTVIVVINIAHAATARGPLSEVDYSTIAGVKSLPHPTRQGCSHSRTEFRLHTLEFTLNIVRGGNRLKDGPKTREWRSHQLKLVRDVKDHAW